VDAHRVVNQISIFSSGERGAAPVLRPYQSGAISKAHHLLREGVRAVLLVAPTGAGKTVIGAELVRQSEEAVLFLAPRRELIHQTCRKLDDVGVNYGVLLAGDPRTNLYAKVQVASVDTLIARALRKSKLTLPTFGLIIVDEAHVGLTETRQRLLELWPGAKIIGLTATPTRSDGKALGRVYDELVEVASVQELVDAGFLVKARYFSVSEPDLKKVRTTAGDFNQLDLDAVMNQSKLIGNIVQHWLEHASTRRTVVFATSIEHSVALAKEFLEHGVSAEHVDASTPQSAREAIFRRFAAGETQVLTNCTLASIGFDLPELDCVVFARPTKSLGLYLQMLGRGLRPAPGKPDCLVLDHAGNVLRHGFATDPRYWTLHGKYAEDVDKKERAKKEREKKGDTELKCPVCTAVWVGGRQCPECGYWFPPKARAIETHDGSLVELTPDGRGPAQHTPQERFQFFRELWGHAEAFGYRQGWAAHKYKERYGAWPEWKWNMEIEQIGGVEPSTATSRWIRSRQIAYRKANGRSGMLHGAHQ
jgi:superfamily II DNA or RNA helicase